MLSRIVGFLIGTSIVYLLMTSLGVSGFIVFIAILNLLPVVYMYFTQENEE